MIYRPLHKDDLPKIAPLALAFCKEIGVDDDTADAMLASIRMGATKGVIAENGSVCGIAGYIPQNGKAVGEFLYVVPERRGIVGGMLFSLGCTQAREEYGCKRMTIFASIRNSGRYKRRGYHVKYEVLEKEL